MMDGWMDGWKESRINEDAEIVVLPGYWKETITFRVLIRFSVSSFSLFILCSNANRIHETDCRNRTHFGEVCSGKQMSP